MASRRAQRLREEMGKLEAQLAAACQDVEHIKGLLSKADTRLLEAAHKRRWYNIIDHLEHTLDEAKARVTAHEFDLRRKARQLEEALAAEPDSVDKQLDEQTTAEEQRIALQASGVGGGALDDRDLSKVNLPVVSQEGADRVLAIPLELISKMTIEEVAELHKDIASEGGGEADAAGEDSARDARAHKLLTKRPPARRPGAPASFHDKLKQKNLRQAVEKVRNDRIETMTIEEIDLITSSYSQLAAQLNAAEDGSPLRDHLSDMLEKIRDKCGQMRRRRAQLYRRQRR